MENKENLNNLNSNLDNGLNNSQQTQSSKLVMEAYISYFRNISNRNQEEVEEKFKQIIEIFSTLSQNDLFANDDSSESEKYFTNQFSPELLRIILNETSKNPVIKDQIQEVLKIYLLEFNKSLTKVGEENPEFKSTIMEKIAGIFNEDNSFFRPISDNKDASDVYFDYIYEKINPDFINWRDNLKPNDYIDYLLRDSSSSVNMYKGKGICNWTRAQILNIDQNKIAQIRLLGNDDFTSISLTSYNIMPYKSLSLDFEFRESLKKGDEIDYLDNKSWYRSTVLDIKETLSLSKFKI
jgi:hypothetical protein